MSKLPVPQGIMIRPFVAEDWPGVWAILEPVFRAGETYVFAPDISEALARERWTVDPLACFVAVDAAGQIIGTYYLKPNQPGLGDHICNCGYAVAESARGKGMASLMCRHSQQEAVQRGFLGMQFNFVVATNVGAIRLWQKMAFDIVGRLPKVFRHPRLGFVDAVVMYKPLSGPELNREVNS